MFLIPLFFTVLVVFAIYALFGENWRDVGTKTPAQEYAPLVILDERLAHGDIDRSEYDEKRRVLEHG